MKREDIPVVYETSSQAPVKPANSMGAVISKLKERINPTKEPEGPFKEN